MLGMTAPPPFLKFFDILERFSPNARRDAATETVIITVKSVLTPTVKMIANKTV
jgi:hypothetical protein